MTTSPRRGFIARLLALAAGAGATGIVRDAHALAGPIGALRADDPWMKRVTGKHRVVIHSHEPTGGLALRWARTFLDTQKASYGLQDSDSSVVVALNGKSVGLVFNDEMWGAYPVGTTLGIQGATNPVGASGSNEFAQLVARGVIVLVCNNSLRAGWQRFLPESARADVAARAAFYERAKTGLLPGTEITPAMIVTLQQAQDLGCRYIYAGG